MKPFWKKYRPGNLKEFRGQDAALNQLQDFLLHFRKQKKKAAFLYGPSGTGKTSSVYAIARPAGLEIIEINASDYRNKHHVQDRIGAALQQHSLFFKGKIILVDEVDGLSGRKDRGGIQALTKLIENSRFPVVLTATNPFDNKFSKLRSRSLMIQFEEVGHEHIHSILKDICKKESIKAEDIVLKGLARRAGGDVRAALNDLHILSHAKKITKKDLDSLGDRLKTETMLGALLRIFKTTNPQVAINAYDTVQEDFDEIFLWLDKNLPEEYTKPADLARAYDKLSKADVFRGRIRRWQHWRYLVYINSLLSAGVAVSKDAKYDKRVMYKPTGRLLKIYWANIKNAKKKAIAQKLAEHIHTSSRRAQHLLPYLKVVFQRNKEMATAIAEELELEREEVAWMKK